MGFFNMLAINNMGVIGAGAWGTALAKHLAEKGVTVRLWAYERDVAQTINARHENSMFLPGVTLPRTLVATSSIADAVEGSQGLLFVVPSHVTRSVLTTLAPCMAKPIPLISATKGIEEETAKLMTQVMDDMLPLPMRPLILALSGPSFAAELSAGKPTAL
jgi:glycerol-3-phosphate dehydrogenase (NAD(P)+)